MGLGQASAQVVVPRLGKVSTAQACPMLKGTSTGTVCVRGPAAISRQPPIQ